MRLPVAVCSLKIAWHEALYLQTYRTCDNLWNYWNNAREGICKLTVPFGLHIQTHTQFLNHSIYMLGQKALIPSYSMLSSHPYQCFCFAKLFLSHRLQAGNEHGLGALQRSLWPDIHSIHLGNWTKASLFYDFCGSPWIFIQINNFFKLTAPGIKPLTLGSQVQRSPPMPQPQGTPPAKFLLSSHIYSALNILLETWNPLFHEVVCIFFGPNPVHQNIELFYQIGAALELLAGFLIE